MKVTEVRGVTGSWGLAAQPEDYDGFPPLGRILFDREPHRASPDRVALASYLFFGKHASANFETPSWHSPALAQAMARDADPVWLQTKPVELYAMPLPMGRRSVVVSLEDVASVPSQVHSTTDFELTFSRSDLSSGSRLSFDSMELSTNAWLSALDRSADERIRIVLGCGVLFAADVDGDELNVSRLGVSDAAAQSMIALLGAVRLGLRLV